VRSTVLVKTALAALFLGAVVTFFALDGHRYVDFEALKASREALLAYRDRHYALTFAVVCAAFVACTAFSLPIATLLSLAIGLLFGRYVGALLIASAGTLGATVLLVVARYVLSDFFRARLAGNIGKLDRALQGNDFLYLALLRSIPVVPFWLVNLVAAFTAIRIGTYVAATFTGMLPISFVWASLGEALETIESPRDALSGTTLSALIALAVLGLVAIFVKSYWIDRRGRPTGKV
jgi:uncharacterized membrane protein YdjX (TVP38/TMEM64 family)